MWFKKKSVLQAEGHYDTETSADGLTDMRTTWKAYTNSGSSILPSASDAGNYFYLPASGKYVHGVLGYVGNYGYGFYWSSSAYPSYSNIAYLLYFSGGSVTVDGYGSNNGLRVGGFE